MDIDTLRATLGDKAKRVEQIGGQVLIQGDCMKIAPLLGRPEALLCDPPYGLGKRMQGGTWGAQDHDSGFLRWDLEAKQEWIDAMIAAECPAIIWGANYFNVPASRCWLMWNKVNAVPTMADFEMAWTSLDRPAKRINLNVGRVEYGHPTQKPTALIEWALGFLPQGAIVQDWFLGSGTTLVACQNLDRNGIGIELDPDYFDIACKRVDEATRQPRLFSEPTPKPTQEGFDL